MDAVADDDPPVIDELALSHKVDGILVSVDSGDRPVGYLLVHPLDGRAHVEQVSVHPDHAGLRLGSQMLDAADGWADQRGLIGLTLTTFEKVPWNAPYYQRLGFRVLRGTALTPGLLHVWKVEAARGLDRWPRVAMLREPRGRMSR